MENGYWIMEYGKVFFGYLFLMFLWPSVVFGGHLKKKTRTYRFSFCVTTQVVIINSVVLGLGLLHILTRWAVISVFYGVFLAALVKRVISLKPWETWKKKPEPARFVWKNMEYKIRERHLVIRWVTREWTEKYGLLAVVLAFGMIYFSYGAVQVHSYGYGDLYVHHEWIYGLTEGNIFSGGVYPEAMHCFIYCLEALFGIRIFSSLLFLQCIHVAVFFLSAYLLMREVFHWRYTPVFVLFLFVTLDVVSADQVYSLTRLQITLPLEFGLYTQFLCALFLLRYLENSSRLIRKGKVSKFYWDENLFLFTMSLAASLVVHFYTAIMAFILCVSFVLFALKKILQKEYLIPLIITVICGTTLAVSPMAGALASGIGFNYSINWAVNMMDGEESREFKSQEEGTEDAGQAASEAEKNENIPQKVLKWVAGKVSTIYKDGYAELYGEKRAAGILCIIAGVLLFCGFAVWRADRRLKEISRRYPQIILFTFFVMLIYTAALIGLPELISDARFCSVGHLMMLAVIVMPVDILFSLLAGTFEERYMNIFSVFAMVGAYVLIVVSGNYRGFLFYELTKYNSVVSVTNSIIDTFPENSYVVVAPTDELYPVIQSGGHMELLSFVKNIRNKNYELAAEYIFVYVEKRPILYAQAYFFEGPSWIGEEKYMEIYWDKYSKKYPESGASQAPEIISGEVSEEEAGKDLVEYQNPWLEYTRFENRTVLESKAYEWCQRFQEEHPSEMKVYYEDENFVCYYFRQNPGEFYNLGME